MVLTTHNHTLNYPFSPPSESDSASVTSTSTNKTTPEPKEAHVVAMAEPQHKPQQQQHHHGSSSSQYQHHHGLAPSITSYSNLHSIKIRGAGAVRRARAPPRNDHGEIYCDHSNCRDSTQTFKRPCEWHKHMDRHERPYKCLEAGCELSPGFTYSGGLLRHQREVHKMHLSTKQPLFCPFPNCNRSSGTGFTRRENLEEHKRRRHLEAAEEEVGIEVPSSRYEVGHAMKSGGESVQIPSRQQQQTLSSEPQQHESSWSGTKRRRISTAAEGGSHVLSVASHVQTVAATAGVATGTGSSSSSSSSRAHGSIAKSEMTQTQTQTQTQAQQLVQRLRDELVRKEDLIRRQTAEIVRLQNFLQSLPPQMVFDVFQSQPQPQPQSHSQISGGDVG